MKRIFLFKSSVCYVNSPRSGLANRLLVWSRGIVFSRENKLPFCNSNWFSIHIGPILRKEKSKRFYYNCLRESTFFEKILFLGLKLIFKIVENPPINEYTPTKIFFYEFNKLEGPDYFRSIRDHRKLVIEEFNKIINPKSLKKLEKIPPPIVSVHIRRGDFRFGSIITPLKYFIEVVNWVREEIGYQGEIMVFSDANQIDLEELLKNNQVKYFNSGMDLLDLILMSKSKVIFTSTASTYSYWAGFISDAVIIRHPEDAYGRIRNEKHLGEFYHDRLEKEDINLLKNVLKET